MDSDELAQAAALASREHVEEERRMISISRCHRVFAKRRSGRRPLLRCGATLLVSALAAIALAAITMPAAASAADCKLADFSYDGACGPQFEMPAWGDGGGWTNPSQYSTIQLADLTGSGIDELIGRSANGIEIYWFDKSVGQWRPALDANGHPEVITDFHSQPQTVSGPSFDQPQYYQTIQTAKLDGPDKGADIIARFPCGLAVFRYAGPKANPQDINGGTWTRVSQCGPFSDKDGYTQPTLYQSIHTASATKTTPGAVWAYATLPNLPPVVGELVKYKWTGSGWTNANVNTRTASFGQLVSANLLNVLPGTALVPGGGSDGLLFRTQAGIKFAADPFKVFEGAADAPFTDASGFASSPSYYETLRLANILGGAGNPNEVLGRTSDGLQAYFLNGDASTGHTSWAKLGTLTDLKGSAESLANTPGRWASIRTGELLGNGALFGDGSDQVLALDGTALQAWSYNTGSATWSKLPATVPLELGGKMWDTEPAYYSTIQVGDVTGPGDPAAVIARGPYGIRTWFYCSPNDPRTHPCGQLGGKSGWASWLPQDTSSYPQFTGGPGKAMTELTSRLKQQGDISGDESSVRDEWTGENAPTSAALDTLDQKILQIAGCSGGAAGLPPFTTCKAPADSAGFTDADWTQVINEILSEIQMAQAADTWFDQLHALQGEFFTHNFADLSAIIGDLKLPKDEGGEATVDGAEIAQGAVHILGAIVALLPGGEALAAGMEVAGEVTSLLTSESPTLTSPFQAKVSEIKDKVAGIVGQIDKGLEVQSHEVRGNYYALKLLAQLTTGNGPWKKIDKIGMESTNDEGFALWAYQQLLPALYARYDLNDCAIQVDGGFSLGCEFTFPAPGSIQNPCPSKLCYTLIGPVPTPGSSIDGEGGTPCVLHLCKFMTMDQVNKDLAKKVWGEVTPTCDYQPGKPETKWTFGDCSLGVSPENSASMTNGPLNGWNFTNYCYDNSSSFGRIDPCQGTAAAATVGHNGRVMLSGTVALPDSFVVKSATIVRNRLLYEPAAQDGAAVELVRRDSGAALGAVHLTSDAEARTLASTAVSRLARRLDGAQPGGVRAQLDLGPAKNGVRSYTITVHGVDVGVPNACQSLPVSDALATPPFELTSTVLVSNGEQTRTLVLPAMWHCVRHRTGVITRLRPAAHRPPSRRPGLAVTVSGPRVVLAGGTATFTVAVHNRRDSSNRFVSSLWDLRVRGAVGTSTRPRSALHVTARVTRRIHELRRGKRRAIDVRVHVPNSSRTFVCVAGLATAAAARPASGQLCAKVIAAPSPSVTG